MGSSMCLILLSLSILEQDEEKADLWPSTLPHLTHCVFIASISKPG